MNKVALFSNYINHHQLPFCKEMVSLTNNNFKFISQKAISLKRIPLGYKDISNDYGFVVKTYESSEELNKAYKIADDYDYVIFGSTSEDYFKNRLAKNKITFEYSERLNKKKLTPYMYVKKYLSLMKHRRKYKNSKLFLLCNGIYVANDYNMFNTYKNKTYKWGYFPEFIEYNIEDLIKSKNSKLTLLWAGRLISWKHPEHVVELAKMLKNDNIDFDLNIIGNGELEESVKELIRKYKLENCIHLLGSMSPEEVRKEMEKSHIFISTSDIGEGWGVVVNEAMNSGCACVISSAVGSAGFLIKHGVNSLIYEDGKIESLYENVTKLLEENLRFEICKQAYKTIKDEWNGEIAAKRFLELAKALDEGKDTPFVSGPCSKAEPIKDKEMYNYLTGKK